VATGALGAALAGGKATVPADAVALAGGKEAPFSGAPAATPLRECS
jgi:hypothetical protein